MVTNFLDFEIPIHPFMPPDLRALFVEIQLEFSVEKSDRWVDMMIIKLLSRAISTNAKLK